MILRCQGDYKTFFDEKKDDETTLMDEESEGDSDSGKVTSTLNLVKTKRD